MIILTIFAFLAGLVTILSPCILPVLPIVLSGTALGGKRRPIGIAIGFVFSFTFFTLFFTTIVRISGISADVLRVFAICVVALFGLSLLIPRLQVIMESIFSKLVRNGPKKQTEDGFIPGLIVGMSLGVLWTPCVGPILASIIALAAASDIDLGAIGITLAYATGTAIPMIAIIYGGRRFFPKNTSSIQKIFGIVMLLTSIAMFTNLDRKFQTYILKTFPNYGVGLTKFEDNALVQNALNHMPDQKKNTAAELITGGQWFNTPSISLDKLRGKVVLIDFWTYTCINCIRTLPYLKNWYAKYKDDGFVIVGVHTPEFEFEKNPINVQKAITDFGIDYPVMQDNDYATWRAYGNRYWPAHYLIDKEGIVQYTHFGEGNYDETEKKIQELLGIETSIENPHYDIQTRTPETYLGLLRGDYSRIHTTGEWLKSNEYAKASAGSTMSMDFTAKNVFLVLRGNGQIKIYLDGQYTKTLMIDGEKLYTLIDLPIAGSHTVKLEFLDDNTELYAFTFG